MLPDPVSRVQAGLLSSAAAGGRSVVRLPGPGTDRAVQAGCADGFGDQRAVRSLDSLSATFSQLAGDLQNGQSYTADLQAAQAGILGICKEALATGVGMIPSN